MYVLNMSPPTQRTCTSTLVPGRFARFFVGDRLVPGRFTHSCVGRKSLLNKVYIVVTSVECYPCCFPPWLNCFAVSPVTSFVRYNYRWTLGVQDISIERSISMMEIFIRSTSRNSTGQQVHHNCYRLLFKMARGSSVAR